MTDVSYGVIPILESTGQVLLVQSAEGKWGFPKGHKEATDESDAATALRELEEETGIMDCELDLDQVFTKEYSFEREGVVYEKTVTFYLGFVTDAAISPRPGEILDARWFDYEMAMQTLSFEDAKKVLEKAYPRSYT